MHYNRVEPVSGYKTTDGKVYDDAAEANKHQLKLDIAEHIRTFGCDDVDSFIDFDELVNWIASIHK